MRKRGWAAIFVIFIMFAFIAAYVFFSYGKLKPEDDKICEGVKVESVEIGGMTREEAASAVDAYLTQQKNRVIALTVNEQTETCRLEDAGYKYSAGDFLDEALSVGKTGNMVENYREIKEAAQGKITYQVDVSLNEEALTKFVKKCKKKMCSEAKNAGIKMENGEFVYTEAKAGVSIDTDETVQMIKSAVEAQSNSETEIKVTANAEVEQPSVTQETAAKCKDKIGTFSTAFNAGNVNRSKNVANAARLISGSVIYPGETFSVHDAISPLTEENGYYEAASYNNGKVEDSLGGGVCQVSTTLYNAVLRAELEIVERSPHSMVVSYVKPSMDAAIAGDYKDFKFKNNTSVPIYIQGGTYSGTIYFSIYGEETRSSDREVRFESEVTETIQPGSDKITYDKTKPESYTVVTQEAHTGYKAKLWKIVTEDGKETKTQVNSSTYSASPRYITKGSKKEPEATQKPEESKKSDSGDTTKKKSGGTGSTGSQNKSSGSSGTSGSSSGTSSGQGGTDQSEAQTQATAAPAQ